jgi:uncharacterized protein YkwD
MPAPGNPRLIPAGGSSAPFLIVTDNVAIGSAPGNALPIGNLTVSRRHAEISRRQNQLFLSDLGATNGTFVNGDRISGPVELKDGDVIRFGAVEYRCVADQPSHHQSFHAASLPLWIATLFAATFASAFCIINFNHLEDLADVPLKPTAGSVDSGGSRGASAVEGAVAERRPLPGLSPAVSFPAVVTCDTSTKSDSPWLAPLNRYRHSVGLDAVSANSRLSQGDYLHSRYIVKNFGERLAAHENLGPEMHFEDPSKPWYSAEGALAGRAGDVDELWSPRSAPPPSWAIDNWMQSPFHRLPILNPNLHSVGYGYDCENSVCIAALNLNSGADPLLSSPAPLAKPIEYPPDGAPLGKVTFDGEWPDPLTTCPGYSLPAGYPITIQLGSLVNPGISSYSLRRTAPASASLEACAFDAGTYRNPDPGTEKMVRFLISNFGAIVIMPRAPLTTGTYQVSLAAGGKN